MHSSDLCKVILNYFTMDTTSKHSAVAPTHFLNLSRTNQQILFVLLLIVCLNFFCITTHCITSGVINSESFRASFFAFKSQSDFSFIAIIRYRTRFWNELTQCYSSRKRRISFLLLFLFFLLYF